MPNENKKQEANIVIEKWNDAQLAARAEAREQMVRREEQRLQGIIDTKYSPLSLDAEVNKRLNQSQKDFLEKKQDNLAKLMLEWADGGKMNALKKEQDAMDQLRKNQQSELEKEEEKLAKKHLAKIRAEEENLKKQEEELKKLQDQLKEAKGKQDELNSPEALKKRQKELDGIEQERKAWSDKNNACIEAYKDPQTTPEQKKDYDTILKQMELQLHELNKKARELIEEPEQQKQRVVELNLAAEQQKRAIQDQKELIGRMNTSYQDARDRAKAALEVNYQDEIGAHEKRKQQMAKWSYNVEEQEAFVEKLKEKQATRNQIKRDVASEFKEAQDLSLRETNGLKKRHNDALEYYKKVEEMQSTKKLFGGSDTRAFKEMIQALRDCGDALISQEAGDEAEEKMARLGAEAYRKCQSYLDQKKRKLVDSRLSDAGSKRRELSAELMDTLRSICPRIKKQLEPEKYSFAAPNQEPEKNDKKSSGMDAGQKEKLNFNQLTNKNTGMKLTGSSEPSTNKEKVL